MLLFVVVFVQVDLKAVPSLIMNRVILRHPKSIHRIRKILTNSAGRLRSLSMGPREQSRWSEESLTPSENKAVLEATSEYHGTSQQYIDEISIDEFTGKGDSTSRIHSVLPIYRNHQTKVVNYGRSVLRRSKSSPFASPGQNSSGCGKENSPAQQNGVEYGTGDGGGGGGIPRTFSNQDLAETRLFVSDREPHEVVTLHGNTSTYASGGDTLWHPVVVKNTGSDQGSKLLLELDVDSDHRIEENTGLKGDSQLSFFTPQGSITSGDFIQGRGDLNDDYIEDDEKSISLPLLTLASGSVKRHLLQQVRRSSSAKLLST